MVDLWNNFDGGAHGTALTVANSGAVPGNDPFQIVDPSSAQNHIEFKDAIALGRATAQYVLLVSVQASATSSAMIWSTAMGSQTQIWWRQYVYLTALPVTVGCAVDAPIFECDNGVAYTGWGYIDRDTGKVSIYNGSDTSFVITANPLPLNAWARLECRMQFSTTTGNVELRLYLEPDSDTPTETVSGSGWNMGGASANSYAFGYPTTIANRPEMYISGLQLSNTGWPGPAPFRPGRGVPGVLTNPTAIHTAVR